jgi:hypothetical protein
VLALIALGREMARRWRPLALDGKPRAILALLPPYTIGSIAMFWVIQRVVAFGM